MPLLQARSDLFKILTTLQLDGQSLHAKRFGCTLSFGNLSGLLASRNNRDASYFG